MLCTICNPSLPTTKTADVFVQTIQLLDGDRQLGRAIWTGTHPQDGVVQIVELWIDPAVRRRGHGRQLFRELISQARQFHQPHKQILRRLWVGVAHKSQVVGRAFLTSEGFHHISTTGGVFQDQDQLIYVKSLD
jgi:ribosomal protein S18 acetylase RimI-like enzyme